MARYRCEKCSKEMEEINFYKYRDGSYVELCKKCLTMHVDVFDPTTFTWLLQKLDVPYIPQEWNAVIENKMAKKPDKPISHSAVFGSYLSKTKLKQWKEYYWADNDRIQELFFNRAAQASEEQAELDAMYQEQFEAGQITEAQYKTLASTRQRNDQLMQSLSVGVTPFLGNDNPYNETEFIDESILPDPEAELTQEDKIYLAMKWGKLYKPSEWIALEKDYHEMTESFDIQDADSKNTLILLCKTNLKANQAIDSGDIEGYQKLAKVSESLRKSAKFTAQQNKDEKGDFVDSIGELIIMCEREGFIPRFCTDIPQDKVDFTLRDQKDYIYKLVTQDLGFGQQIEDALKKIEVQRQIEEEERLRAEEQGDEYDPYTPVELTDEDMFEELESVQEQIEQDYENLFRGDK